MRLAKRVALMPWVLISGYRMARRNGYSFFTALRFARLSLYEHPSARKKKRRIED
ncbi:MAG: hypothetical protein M3R55_09375 [Acidobacteriota bacterium]|nr:hypothetical protein [Acidobacteriota bacterium]